MTSHPEWNEKTTATEVAKAFGDQIKGKNVVVTGVGPNSLGESLALAIASQSPSNLVLVSRTQSKLDEVVKKIKDAYPSVTTKTVILDLMKQASVRMAAEEVNSRVDKIDVLINNAGIMIQDRRKTDEGIDGQFGTNHIGPFLFTNLLIPKMKAAAKTAAPGATRIVNVSSAGHRLSPIRFHDYNFEGKEVPEEEMHPTQLPPVFLKKDETGYLGFVAYGQSKTANVLFTVALTDKLKDSGIISWSLHPGGIWSGLVRDLDDEGAEAIRKTAAYWKSCDEGASTSMVAAFDPALGKPIGNYLVDCQIDEAVPHATDPKIAERLWGLSEQLVGREFKL